MNNVSLIGNLTRKVELRQNKEGVSFGTFNIAVNDGFGESKKTYFFPIVVSGAVAENCAKFLDKGSKVAVAGKLTEREYKKADGSTSKIVEVRAFEVEFLTPSQKKETTLTEVEGEDLPF